MVRMIDYPGGFDFAYKGYQYPLPPSWKYAIRLEDQIQWLLQALLLINDTAVSHAMLEAGLADTLEEAKEYADRIVAQLDSKISDDIHNLSDIVDKLQAGISLWISPVVDGTHRYAPYIDKQLFNGERPYLITYGELDSYFGGKTYDDAKTEFAAYTCYKLAFYGAVICGLVEYGDFDAVLERCKPYYIDEEIYAPVYPSTIYTWDELKLYGAMTCERR